MKDKTSILKVKNEKRMPRRLNKLAIIASFLAITVVVLLILTFVNADQIMRTPGKPLSNFSSNIMPDYRLASFPSLDEQTRLSGWFFPARTEAISTIIMIHDNQNNRLQFELDSPALFEFLVDQGFNVLAFDLRNSGKSDGQLSSYGYAEWSDVLAAIQYARQYTSTSDVVLYGIGSGVSAALMAWEELPPAGTTQEDYPAELQRLTYDRSYIRAVILDTPAITPDIYIQADCRNMGNLGTYLLQYTVPYAIRLSAGHPGSVNHITLISQMQIPALLTWSESDSHIGNSSISPLVQERLRLHPDTTHTFESKGTGYCQGWINDQEQYAEALKRFFSRYVY